MTDGLLALEPFEESSLQPASYDLRVGTWAFSSSSKEKVDVSKRGVLVVEPGDFAVVETLEQVRFGNQIAGQLGLRSEFARKGLLMLSGPQVDPGFQGTLVVRLVNLAPTKIALPYKAPFLTAQFFKLTEPVENEYVGSRQGQEGISTLDIQELAETEGLTLGEMVKTLQIMGKDVSELKGAVSRLSWSIPIIIGVGIAIISLIVGLK